MGSSVILPAPGQPTEGPDPSFKTATLPGIVSFGFQGITPPSPLYLRRDDELVLEAIASTANTRFTIKWRLLLPYPPQAGQPAPGNEAPTYIPQLGPGFISDSSQDLTTAASFTPQVIKIPLAEGFLLSLSVTSQSTQRGVCYTRVWLNRGPAQISVPNTTWLLLADYATVNHPVTWPGGRQLFSTEGPGNLETVTVTNPAAGADWFLLFPANSRRRISSFNAQLAIANAGTARIIRVQIKDAATNLVWQAAAQQTGAINTTVQVSGAPGQVTSTTDPATLNLTLPGTDFVGPGGQLSVSTSNIQPTDQWTNIQVAVEEWIDAL